jgi:hypothetical protein
MRHTVMLTLSSCLAFLGMAGCYFRDFDSSDRYQSDFHYSYALNPGGRLEVDNFNGSIEITGWDQANCEINGSRFASTAELRDRIKIDVNHSGSLIYIHSVRPAGEFHGNMGVRYVIHVPRKIELSRITTSNGPIHVEGTEGRAELKTSNGPVRVESLAGELNAHTSNGPVTIENVSGGMSLHTSNSAIRVQWPHNSAVRREGPASHDAAEVRDQQRADRHHHAHFSEIRNPGPHQQQQHYPAAAVERLRESQDGDLAWSGAVRFPVERYAGR